MLIQFASTVPQAERWSEYEISVDLLRKELQLCFKRLVIPRELNDLVDLHTRSKKEASCNANVVNALLANAARDSAERTVGAALRGRPWL